MKALRMYKPGDLRVEEAPIPVPQEGEVLLKVQACGVCGSDIPRINKFGAHVSPIIPGHEFSAEIVDVGKNVTDWGIGDRVTVPPLMPCYKCHWCKIGQFSLCEDYDYFGSRRDGAMAQYLACPTTNLMRLANSISWEDAATTDPCANAMHALHISEFQAGETVCVYGAGPIGLYAVQCAKALGAKTVISVDINDEKIEVARKCGADFVINSIKEDAPAKVKDLTYGGADIVIDVTGAPIAQVNCLMSAKKLGRIVLLGISHKPLDLPEKAVDNIMRSQLRILGSWNSFDAPFPGKDWEVSLQLMERGLISSKHMISHRLSLEEGPDIFRKIDAGGYFFNKILFFPWK